MLNLFAKFTNEVEMVGRSVLIIAHLCDDSRSKNGASYAEVDHIGNSSLRLKDGPHV
jgi:hypothetical protein